MKPQRLIPPLYSQPCFYQLYGWNPKPPIIADTKSLDATFSDDLPDLIFEIASFITQLTSQISLWPVEGI